MERPKAIHLKKILGLTPDCDGDWYHYKYRNQWADYQETEKFYKQFPPEVGQTVVVLRTFYQEMFVSILFHDIVLCNLYVSFKS